MTPRLDMAIGHLKRIAGRGPRPDMEADFLDLYERCRSFTMTSIERMYALYWATKYVAQYGVPGAITECGVWRGGSSMLSALTLLRVGDQERDLYLYDTYAGMPRPDGHDVDHRGNPALRRWLRQQETKGNRWAYASFEEVQASLLSTGYPMHRVHLVKGKVEETIPTTSAKQIALLRLDTDWYESTRHELQHLYPRLSPGGVLIIDDYGHWQGARQATDEYFAKLNEPILLNRIDYTGRIAVRANLTPVG